MIHVTVGSGYKVGYLTTALTVLAIKNGNICMFLVMHNFRPQTQAMPVFF